MRSNRQSLHSRQKSEIQSRDLLAQVSEAPVPILTETGVLSAEKLKSEKNQLLYSWRSAGQCEFDPFVGYIEQVCQESSGRAVIEKTFGKIFESQNLWTHLRTSTSKLEAFLRFSPKRRTVTTHTLTYSSTTQLLPLTRVGCGRTVHK